MKQSLLLFFIVTGFGLSLGNASGVYAQQPSETLEQKLSSIFGSKKFEVNDYDDQLKQVSSGSTSYFISHDGRYVFAGPVYDTQRKVDIVLEQDNNIRKFLLNEASQDLFVSYPSTVDDKHKITVITDIDCPYCRKLHNSMDTLNQHGISVNYVMLPRAGRNSASYKKTLHALCSKNPAETITQAMRNQDPAIANCEPTQLDQQMKLARDLKISSTPSIVLPSGELKVGLLNPDQLLGLLERVDAQ